MAKKTKALTVILDAHVYTEFAAACILKRQRTLSAPVYSFVLKTIEDAKADHSKAEFAQAVKEQQVEIDKRSALKKSGGRSAHPEAISLESQGNTVAEKNRSADLYKTTKERKQKNAA